jgi:hypothetical protein
MSKLDIKNIDWKIAGYVTSGNNYFHNGFNKTYEISNDENLDWLVSILSDIAQRQLNLIDPNSKIQSLIRAQMTYTVQDGKMRDADIHQDNNTPDSWSFLFYLIGDSGNTDFFDTMFSTNPLTTVNIKQSRLVFFPSVYAHRGHIPDSGERLIANLVFIVDTSLNDKILEKSPTAIRKMYKENT